MPLPFGHSLMGYALYETTTRKAGRFNWKSILLFAFVANLPDIDFLPGLLMGEPGLYHRHYLSHSIGAAVLIGLLFGLYGYYVRKERFLNWMLLFATIYFSHVFLDYFGNDFSTPQGVPMLWPFSETYFISPVLVFMSVSKSGQGFDFLLSLFVKHNLLVALWEIVVFVPILSIIFLVKQRDKLFSVFSNKEVDEKLGRAG